MDQTKPVPEGTKVYVEPNGEMVEVVLPHSEVCMHMRVADKRAYVKLITPEGKKHPVSAQIYMRDKLTKFSSPILFGEAGIYCEKRKFYYYTPPAATERSVWVGEVSVAAKTGFEVGYSFPEDTGQWRFVGEIYDDSYYPPRVSGERELFPDLPTALEGFSKFLSEFAESPQCRPINGMIIRTHTQQE